MRRGSENPKVEARLCKTPCDNDIAGILPLNRPLLFWTVCMESIYRLGSLDTLCGAFTRGRRHRLDISALGLGMGDLFGELLPRRPGLQWLHGAVLFENIPRFWIWSFIFVNWWHLKYRNKLEQSAIAFW